MKILVCNTPITKWDGEKTVFPPLGAMAIIQWLTREGYEVLFNDINYFEPSDEELSRYLLEHQFDIIGISATTSATYNDTKKLIALAQSVLPNVITIVGGALAFSSEILLRLAKADFCVIGEGERPCVNLVNYLAHHGMRKASREGLHQIRGLSFLDASGDVVFTGYEKALIPKEIPEPDYEILKRFSVIDQYIPHPFVYEQFKYDERSLEPHRRDKRLGTVISSRGCIARCTFCHRRQQGIKVFPVDAVLQHARHLIDHYNVGFVSFGDEDFGATKKWIAEFAERMSDLGILYRLGAVRVDNINPELLRRLRDSGCVAIHYGWESGSNRMLTVMEKMVTAEKNYEVARWTEDAGLQTVPALVVGMPGENYETIEETTRFVCTVTENSPREPVASVNQLVALPGTPVYEYARKRGNMGTTLEDEERYLILITDKGGDSSLNLNLTDYPMYVVQGWIRCIYWSMRHHYFKQHQIPAISTPQLIARIFQYCSGQSRRGKVAAGILTHPLFYRMRHVIAPIYVSIMTFKEIGLRLFLWRWLELLAWPFRKKYYEQCLPLREYLRGEIERTVELGATNVKMLRLGR